MSEQTIKIRVSAGTKYINSWDSWEVDTEVTPEERKEMGEDAFQDLCDELGEQILFQRLVQWNWEEV